MDIRLDGKVALVTGGSYGIGHAIAAGLSEAGAAVMICARDAAQLGAARDRILALSKSAIVETFRYSFLGSGTVSWGALGYSAAVTLAILVVGTVVFNKVQKSFTDTV